MQEYSLVSLVRTVHARRKPLVYATVGALVLTAVVTLFLPNYYRSTTTFYAASQDLFKPQKVFGYNQSEMYYYGSGEDIQRVLTAAVSRPVLQYLIDTFDLYDHYRVERGSPKAEYKLTKKLLERYRVVRTKYDAIELTVEDRDPAQAAAMANGARKKLNSMLTEIIKSSQRDLIVSYRSAIQGKQLALVAVEDSLRKYQGEYGIYDPESQSEYLSTLITSVETDLVRARGSLESFEKSNKNQKFVQDTIIKIRAAIEGLEMQRQLLTGSDTLSDNRYNLGRFIKGKGRVELYADAYERAIGMVNQDREMAKQMEAAIALDVTALHLVESASVPEVKARPKRSLIVLAVGFVVFAITLFGILLAESLKKEDWTFLRW